MEFYTQLSLKTLGLMFLVEWKAHFEHFRAIWMRATFLFFVRRGKNWCVSSLLSTWESCVLTSWSLFVKNAHIVCPTNLPQCCSFMFDKSALFLLVYNTLVATWLNLKMSSGWRLSTKICKSYEQVQHDYQILASFTLF